VRIPLTARGRAAVARRGTVPVQLWLGVDIGRCRGQTGLPTDTRPEFSLGL
jgi:hypothetical protein